MSGVASLFLNPWCVPELGLSREGNKDGWGETGERGMGFGLPFVKKVISEHLGNISIVQSTPEGTHIQIEIPQNGIMNIN